MQENAKWLDSIEGKTYKLKNAMQTLWSNIINSQTAKNLIDFLTKLVYFLDTPVGKITALSAALMMWGKRMNLLPFTSINGEFAIFGKTLSKVKADAQAFAAESSGLASGIKSIFAAFTKSSNGGTIDISNMLSETEFNSKINSIISGFNNAGKAVDGVKWEDYVNGLANVDDATRQALLSCQQHGNVVTANAGAYNIYTGATTSAAIGTNVVGGAAVATTGKLIAMRVAAIAANAALTYGIGAIVSWAASAVASLLAVNKQTEEFAQSASQLKGEFDSAMSEISNNIKTLKSLEDEFESLAACVDDYGNNISLSADDYARYQEIVESIIDMTPELIAGYDAEGNAIVNKNALIERSIELLREEQRLEAGRYSTGSNFRTFVKGLEEEIGNANSKDQVAENFANELLNVFTDENRKWYNFVGFQSNQDSGVAGMQNFYALLGLNGKKEYENWDAFGAGIPLLGPAANAITTAFKKDDWEDAFENDIVAVINAMKEHEADIVGTYMTQERFDSLIGYLDEYHHADNLSKVIQSYQDEYTDLLWMSAQSSTDFYDLSEQQQGWLKQYIEAAFPIPEDGGIEGQIYNAREKILAFVTKFKNDAVLQSFVDDAISMSMGVDKHGAKLKLDDFYKEYEAMLSKIKELYGQDVADVFADMALPDNYAEAREHLVNLLSDPLLIEEAKKYPNQTKYAELMDQATQEYQKALEQLTVDELFLAYKISAAPGSMTLEELKQAIAELKKEMGITVVPTKTYTAITEDIKEYLDVLSQTSEIISDDISVTQEYKDALVALGISESELNECFYEGNPLVVKNAQALNKLVDEAKDSTAQNIKLAKSYARLEYRDLYKELKSVTKGTQVTDEATKDYIDSLYDQMKAIQKTIAKYSLLEAELLGAANAYKELEAAQEADEAADYGSKAEELVNILSDAFNTSQLGTESARVAIEGLIPDEIFEKADTLDEKMAAIYEYFTNGKVSQLFTIEFDDEGAIQSVKMTKENVQAFAESLMGDDESSVFQGTWDEFMLNPAITSLEDFADMCGVTEEVALAFLTELEKYDIGNIFGGESILDQLMGDNFEYQMQKAIQYATELEKKVANGTLTTDSDEYKAGQAKVEALEEEALANAVSWSDIQNQIDAKNEELKKLRMQWVAAGALINGDAIRAGLEEQMKVVGGDLDVLVAKLEELEEPDEYILTIAKEESLENIAQFKKEIEDGVKIGAKKQIGMSAAIEHIDTAGLDELEDLGFEKDANGEWIAGANVNIKGWKDLDEDSRKKILQYINMIEDDHKIDVMLGSGTPTVEETLQSISTTLQDIAEMLSVAFDLEVNSEGAYQKVDSFKTLWEGIKDKKVTLTQAITSFFTRTPDDGDDAVNVNGNAHFGGGAYAGGTVGAKKTETSLVGELGPEILVRNGRWTTVGNNGAEFTHVKKGDIIFNHRQSAELLKNGHITGRGKAYAGGTAYAFSGIRTWNSSYNALNSDYSGGTIDTSDLGSNESAEDFIDAIDWITYLMEEYAEKIDKLNARLDLAVGAADKNAIIDDLIHDISHKGRDSEDAAIKYQNKANEYLSQLSKDLQWKVINGTIDIQDITEADGGEDVVEAIENYRNYAQLAAEAEVEALAAQKEIAKLSKQKFDNLAADYEHNITLLEEQYSLAEALIDLNDNEDISEHYDNLISNKQKILTELYEEKNALQALLDAEEKAWGKEGNIKKDSDEWREMTEQIAALDSEIAQCGVDLEDLALDKLNAVQNQFERTIELAGNFIDMLKAQVDLQEESGEIASAKYYEEMLKKSKEMSATLQEQREAMQDVLDTEVAAGRIKVGSEEWYEMVNAINEVDANIIECTSDMESFQNAINDIYWDNFDELMNRINYFRDEIENIIDIISDEDMFVTPDSEDGWGADDVKWSEEGLASLGLYAQQMEIAEYATKQYAEQIEELEKNRDQLIADGVYSESEYLEKLNELKDAQYDSIKAYQDAKDAIVDLHKARVDEIKNGIEKEIEAFEKLINKKKEALDAEKDLYDFQKSITDKQKNIADIERKLAALAYDQSASARAQRAKLEAELYEAKADLEEEYYDRSISDQQDALDKQLEDFKEQKDSELEKWDEYLENVEVIIAESFATIQENADTTSTALENIASKYGITLSNEITTAWANGENAISKYDETFGDSSSATIEQLGNIKNAWQDVIDKINEAADANINYKNSTPDNSTTAGDNASTNGDSNNASNSSESSDNNSQQHRTEDDYYGVALAIWNGNYGWGTGNERVQKLISKGFDANKMQTIVDQLGRDGYVHSGAWKGKYNGITDLSKYHFNKYAKGTTGVNKDQLALIDELGEELVVGVQNGRLTYLSKGSGVIPADLTSNLMSWGELDPQDMLDRNRPHIVAPHIVNNEINIDCSVGTLMNIEHCDQNTLPDVEKLVSKAFDKHMQTLNNSIRRYTR